jgi:hypothetical protein
MTLTVKELKRYTLSVIDSTTTEVYTVNSMAYWLNEVFGFRVSLDELALILYYLGADSLVQYHVDNDGTTWYYRV